MAFIERTGEHEIRRGMSRMDFMRPMFTGFRYGISFRAFQPVQSESQWSRVRQLAKNNPRNKRPTKPVPVKLCESCESHDVLVVGQHTRELR